MGPLRVRWSALGRWVGGGVLAILAIQLLPSLLKPPPPGPLAADIGLPRVRPATRPRTVYRARLSAARPVAAPQRRRRKPHPKTRRSSAARPKPAPEPQTLPPPLPVAAEASAPPPPPPPAPAAPAPAPPGDGSAEFAPH